MKNMLDISEKRYRQNIEEKNAQVEMEKNKQFEYCSIDHSRKLLDCYKLIYKHDTVPMIVKLNTENDNEEFIGGYTELKKLIGDS